jgi:hypothetical protein
VSVFIVSGFVVRGTGDNGWRDEVAEMSLKLSSSSYLYTPVSPILDLFIIPAKGPRRPEIPNPFLTDDSQPAWSWSDDSRILTRASSGALADACPR